MLLAAPVNNFRLPPGDVTMALPFRVPPENPHDTLYEQMRLIGIDLNERTLDNLPTLTPDQMSAIASALGIENNPFAGAGVTMMDEDFRNPMARQAGGGVQREIRPDWSLGADVLVVDTVRLERNRDLNVPLPTVRSDDPAQRPFFGLRSGTARPVSTLDSITVRESTASALYRALTISSEVLIAKTPCNLHVTIVTGNHHDLLVQLRRLRQGVELAEMHSTGHQVIAGAFRSVAT